MADAPRPSRFIEAAKRGNTLLMQEYLANPEKKLNVDKVDTLAMTALHWAARGGHVGTVQFLIEVGASVNIVDKMGETPLHKAAFARSAACCSALVAAGADREAQNLKGARAIDLTEDRSTRLALAPPQFTDEEDRPIAQEDSDSD
jgi:ankyrin repeat protein